MSELWLNTKVSAVCRDLSQRGVPNTLYIVGASRFVTFCSSSCCPTFKLSLQGEDMFLSTWFSFPPWIDLYKDDSCLVVSFLGNSVSSVVNLHNHQCHYLLDCACASLVVFEFLLIFLAHYSTPPQLMLHISVPAFL